MVSVQRACARNTHMHTHACTQHSSLMFILFSHARAHRFVLPPGSSQLKYYKSENDQMNGKDALGPGVTAAATLGYTELTTDNTASIGNSETDGTYFVVGMKVSF